MSGESLLFTNSLQKQQEGEKEKREERTKRLQGSKVAAAAPSPQMRNQSIWGKSHKTYLLFSLNITRTF